ncbi:MAG: hypothetical protein FWC36_06425 [Spirochaetes bacterium]|nr:hypothetical protein [Spirochaetota bacterium]
MIRFLAELSTKIDTYIHPTPSNNYDKRYNVYEIDINEYPEESYWLDWGGYYDNFSGSSLELYYSQFLMRVQTLEEVFYTPFSLFITADNIVLFNVPKHPWLYPDYSTEINSVIPFISSALDPANPSNNRVKGMLAAARLEMPNFTVKLSDAISGITLNQGFTLSLINNDGYFDNDEKWNLFNTPVRIKKATMENPGYNDFKAIRTGLVENITTTFDKFQITVADRLRSMGEPVCDVLRQSMFPGIIIDEKDLNKNIPLVYGTKKIKLLKLNDTNYIAAEYVTSVNGVFDRDGNNIFYGFNPLTGVITVTGEPDSAIITGYTNNKIGEIIKDIISRKTNIQFNNSNWNLDELNQYIDISAPINIVLSSGNVKAAIQNILKNDMAFFIQQIDGRFTIRKYGTEYAIHEIPAWSATKKPEKIFDSAQEHYFSSCIINYDFIEDDRYKSFLFADRENQAENNFRRRVRKTFDTELIYEEDALVLSKLLSDRYTAMRQTLKLAIGIDTSGFELLDTVVFNAAINKREFSSVSKFIIKEINPAQDMLVLEEL